jgi:hypothetical protein
MTAAVLVKALGGRHGMARCPAHDDREPSLSVRDLAGVGRPYAGVGEMLARAIPGS